MLASVPTGFFELDHVELHLAIAHLVDMVTAWRAASSTCSCYPVWIWHLVSQSPSIHASQS